jgi:hypothetical protein
MKITVGRCPESGAPLGSQSTISRLENAPSKTDAARLTVALVDKFGTTVTPGRMEMFDIDDTFCVAHGGQQLAFWNAHHDERGFAPMHIYHVASGTPVVAILRPARTANGAASWPNPEQAACSFGRRADPPRPWECPYLTPRTAKSNRARITVLHGVL